MCGGGGGGGGGVRGSDKPPLAQNSIFMGYFG